MNILRCLKPFSNSLNCVERKITISQAMSMETIDISLMNTPIYLSLMDEIMALPERKQAKWRGFVQDTNGVKHRLHFINGELVFKHHSKWITLKPQGLDELFHDLEYNDPIIEEQHRRLNKAYEHGGIVAEQEEHNRMVDEAATGNHRSKPHKIKVPTKSGEPVRG